MKGKMAQIELSHKKIVEKGFIGYNDGNTSWKTKVWFMQNTKGVNSDGNVERNRVAYNQ